MNETRVDWSEFNQRFPAHVNHIQLKDFIRDEVERAREVEKGRAILVMAEFVREKGEDYPLGKYLNMLLALQERIAPKKKNQHD